MRIEKKFLFALFDAHRKNEKLSFTLWRCCYFLWYYESYFWSSSCFFKKITGRISWFFFSCDQTNWTDAFPDPLLYPPHCSPLLTLLCPCNLLVGQPMSEWLELGNLLPLYFMWKAFWLHFISDHQPTNNYLCCHWFHSTPQGDNVTAFLSRAGGVSAKALWPRATPLAPLCDSGRSVLGVVRSGNKPWAAVRQLEAVENGIVKYEADKGLFWSRLVREAMTNYRGHFSVLLSSVRAQTKL